MVQYMTMGVIKILKAQSLLIEENVWLAGKCTNVVQFKGDCVGGSVRLEKGQQTMEDLVKPIKAFELNDISFTICSMQFHEIPAILLIPGSHSRPTVPKS